MALQTLHTITIDDLAFHNPALHTEYLTLVTSLIEFIRDLANTNTSLTTFSSLSEKYDTNTNEAYLDLIISDGKETHNSRIYIHRNEKFIIKQNGSDHSAETAADILDLVRKQMDGLIWI